MNSLRKLSLLCWLVLASIQTSPASSSVIQPPSPMDQLKRSFFEILLVLGALSPVQRSALAAFERSEEDPIAHDLRRIVEAADERQLEFLIRSSQNVRDDPRMQELIRADSFLQALTNAQVDAFGCVFRLLLLQETLHQCFNQDQLLAFLEMCRMSGITADLHLSVLQQFQQILSQMLPELLQTMHGKVASAMDRPKEASRIAFGLLEDCQNQSLLNQPLVRLLNADLDTVMHTLEVFPRLQPIQVVQLVRMMQMETENHWGILEIRQLLSPDQSGWRGLQDLLEEDTDDLMNELGGLAPVSCCSVISTGN